MKDNTIKKGFTLVELLVVVLILGLLMTIAVPGIMTISNRFKTRGLDSKIEAIEDAAVVYAQENSNRIKNELGGVCNIPVENKCECDKKDSSGEWSDCKYIFTMTVDELIKEGKYKSETPNDPNKCDVTDPTDSDKCLDCVPITIKLDDDYKNATAELDKSDIKDNKSSC